MLTVYLCLVDQHDLRLVALAAAVCAVSAFAAVNLLHHVLRYEDALRTVWLGVASLATGAGIWATHFTAMLAFNPGVHVGYNAVLTVASLAVAVGMTGLGFLTAICLAYPLARALGGAIVGLGVALMHYMGMDAFEVSARIQWNHALVFASLALGVLLGAAALEIGLRRLTRSAVACGSVLLAGSICGLHFTAMAAATVIPGPAAAIPANAIQPHWLAVLVSLAALAILLLALAALALDVRDRRRVERESDRMRGLANAAFEGLLVCDEDAIVAVNASLIALIGAEEADLIGGSLASILPDASMRPSPLDEPNRAVETKLRSASGAEILVEAIRRSIVFAGRPHSAIAVRDLRDRKRAQRVIEFLAHNDALTGLANRATFNNTLEDAIAAYRREGRLAVLRFDIDRFKEINDLFGYAAADELLRTVARCASDAIEPGCLIARVGGDEFAVIIPELTLPSHAGRIAQRLFDALRVEREKSSGGALAIMSVSAGVAIFPGDGDDATSLMANAETALNRAKLEGRSTYRFFEAAMSDEARERRLIEHDLRNALARDELSLVFQPQARASDQQIVGFEALLRWTNAERGATPPGIFIPIAEESGLIAQIDEWVVREACREAAAWANPLGIAVNVSAVQLHNERFPEFVHQVLFQTGLAARRLELEITETALVRDLNRALTMLRQLKALGVRIAMDDFGTGYSSLSNLRAFPFDKIKIDASFVRNVDENGQAAAIVRAVLGLGSGLGLPVIAEGVEREGELAFLRAEGCQEVQGYYIGRPQAIESFAKLVGRARGEAEAKMASLA
jgi:diguanylate cyclase (GGDEF)-like protein